MEESLLKRRELRSLRSAQDYVLTKTSIAPMKIVLGPSSKAETLECGEQGLIPADPLPRSARPGTRLISANLLVHNQKL